MVRVKVIILISKIYKSPNNLRVNVARFAILLLSSLLIVYFAITISTINVNENITKMFSLSEDLDELNQLYRRYKFKY
jgi:hypothetical protein